MVILDLYIDIDWPRVEVIHAFYDLNGNSSQACQHGQQPHQPGKQDGWMDGRTHAHIHT